MPTAHGDLGDEDGLMPPDRPDRSRISGVEYIDSGERTGTTEPVLLFVGGPPRSGTTLVQNMLDSHPNILGLPEFMVVADIMRIRRRLRDLVRMERIDLICSESDVDDAVSQMIRRLLTARVSGDPVHLLSEKTPENCLVFMELADSFPDAKLVAVLRDPRGIVASLLRVGQRGAQRGQPVSLRTASFFEAICATSDYLAPTLAARMELGARIHTVRYEDLVSDPEGEMRRLSAHLELPFTAAMLQPSAVTHLGEKAITVKSGEVWYSSDEYNRDPDPSGADRWRTDLSPLRQAVIVASTRKLLGRSLVLPYELSLVGYGFFVRTLARTIANVVTLYDHRIVRRLVRVLHMLVVRRSPDLIRLRHENRRASMT